MIENMVARDGVEPPTPAFSERNFQVVSTTYKVSRDCLTTCKYVVGGRKTGGRNGCSKSFLVRSCFASSPRLASGAYFIFAARILIVRDDGVRFGDGQATAVKVLRRPVSC